MSKIESFTTQINEGYFCKGDNITLGCGIVDGEVA